MFDAVVARKARLSAIIDGAGKQPREDLITSSMFGALRLLTLEARAKALETLCGFQFAGDVRIHLWPFFRGTGENAEPDVVLEAISDGRRVFWIVEVKWGAGLGTDQAGREIRTTATGRCRRGFLPAEPRDVIGYTLLGAEKKHEAAIKDLSTEFPDKPCINGLAWANICDRLRELVATATDPGLIAWAKMCGDFLAGEPQGAVLGPWLNDLLMPGEDHFQFDADEDFRLPPMAVVLPVDFEFG